MSPHNNKLNLCPPPLQKIHQTTELLVSPTCYHDSILVCIMKGGWRGEGSFFFINVEAFTGAIKVFMLSVPFN